MTSDFAASWELSRGRFDQEMADLTLEQLRFRPTPQTLSIGEMALHVAAVEVWFICQMRGETVPESLAQLVRCATEGVVNNNPFPFSEEEVTVARVSDSLAAARELVAAVIYAPTEAQLAAQVQSALGPIIDGRGALARIAFHSGYHHGQAYLYRQLPGFPTA